MDKLRAFEVFATVVARGGFARAAAALQTSPANVTRYVNELEAHLGTRLLNRTSRRLSLTESGEALYERARVILEDVAEAEGVVAAGALQPRGRLRVNAPVSFGILHLAPLWPRFLATYPEVELDVSLTDRVVDLVDEGFDLAVRISRGGSTVYVARRLATSRNVLCASPDYVCRHGVPAAPTDLKDHACIGFTYGATGEEWRFEDAAGGWHAVRVRYAMQTDNGDTARAATLAGVGISWQPTFLVGEDLRVGRLQLLLPGYRMADIEIQAVYPSRRHLGVKVRAMVDFLAEAFQGVPPWDRE